MKTYYSISTLSFMQLHANQLTEKSRRRYAAVEAEKLGHGGISYISNILGMSRKTIKRGLDELKALAGGGQDLPTGKQRQAGGGRKKILQKA